MTTRWVKGLRPLALLAGLLLACAAAGQDVTKKKGGRLPAGWSLLTLDRSQAEKIREIDRKARLEVAKLNEQIWQVRVKARRDQLAVLMPAQRKLLCGEDEGRGKPADKGKGKAGE
jgi:Spy/CpxP family protein refolding chaperone